ncbi:MAG: hypothetical protein M1830_005331 [Pleopsidium flavum]|nr:MAG: hypothetical protein M1830_005331 [Pleopsidium flavum]
MSSSDPTSETDPHAPTLPQPPTKSFSLSFGAPKPKPSRLSYKPLTSSSNCIPKHSIHSSLHDSSDEDDSAPAQAELVSAFDTSAGGAIGVFGAQDINKKRELVIVGQRNRDWREESRRKKGRGRDLLPEEARAARQGRGEGGREVVNGGVQAFGLSFVTKTAEGGVDGDGELQVGDAKVVELGKIQVATENARVKTEDEVALEALLGEGGPKKSNMVLPAVETQRDDEVGMWSGIAGNGVNEDDAFRSDVASRPDSSSLEDYAAVPVEEFGAALLRGMGWKEGEVVGKRKDQISKPRVVERRPALLGIGAKEVPGGVGDEIGAWGQAAKGRRKVDKTYNPVLLRNSKTGEMLTEDELKVKKEDQKREKEDWRQRKDRNLMIDQEKKAAKGRGTEIVIVSVTGDVGIRKETMRVAGQVLRGDHEADHQRGDIEGVKMMMMVTIIETGSAGDEIEMMIPMILILPGAVARKENVTTIPAAEAGRKSTELCAKLWTTNRKSFRTS